MGVEGYLAIELEAPDDWELIEQARMVGIDSNVYLFVSHTTHKILTEGVAPDSGDLHAWQDYFRLEGVNDHDLDWMTLALGSFMEPRYGSEV